MSQAQDLDGIAKDTLIKDSTILFIATMSANVSYYIFHIFMSRELGPNGYGILNALLTLLLVIGIPLNTTQTIIAKYVSMFYARSEYRKITYLIKAFAFRFLILGIIGFFIFSLASGWISSFFHIGSLVPVILLGVTLFISLYLPLGLGVLQGLGRFYSFGMGIFLQAFLRLLFGVTLALMSLGVNGAMSGVALAALVTLIVIFSFFIRSSHGYSMHAYPQKRGREHKEAIGLHLQQKDIQDFFGAALITLVCFGIITNIDILVVKHFFSGIQAGYYSAASMVGRGLIFLCTAISMAMFPKISACVSLKQKPHGLLLKSLALAVLSLAAGIAICWHFPDKIALIFGENFLPAVPYFRAFPIAVSPVAIAFVLINYIMANKFKGYLYVILLGAILHISLLSLFHQTLMQVITIVGITGTAVLLGYLLYLWWVTRRGARDDL